MNDELTMMNWQCLIVIWLAIHWKSYILSMTWMNLSSTMSIESDGGATGDPPWVQANWQKGIDRRRLMMKCWSFVVPNILGLLDMSQSTNWRAPFEKIIWDFNWNVPSRLMDPASSEQVAAQSVGLGAMNPFWLVVWNIFYCICMYLSIQLGIILPIDYSTFFRGVEANHQPDITWY